MNVEPPETLVIIESIVYKSNGFAIFSKSYLLVDYLLPCWSNLSIAIDRSQWGRINLFMVSLIWERRAIPLYWSLLPKLGNSNFESQTTNLQQVLPLFSEYKVIVLGDREFCSVDLGNWLR